MSVHARALALLMCGSRKSDAVQLAYAKRIERLLIAEVAQ